MRNLAGCGRRQSGEVCLAAVQSFGGASAVVDLLAVSPAGGGECGECLLDAFGGEVALEQVAQLGAGKPCGGGE